VQLRLTGVDDDALPSEAAPKKHRFFFAIRPDRQASDLACAIGRQLRAKHNLWGAVFAPERLHVTLSCFYTDVTVPTGLLELAKRAGNSISAEAFCVSFDSAHSFAGEKRNKPLVLSGSNGTHALVRFRQDLTCEMAKHFMGSLVREDFVPHMTLLYDRLVVERDSVASVSWTAHELLLIHSYVGLTKHVVIGRWPLRK
jgi:RNA 2',3'-cyclic 3'-phosphodiesterase